MTGEELADGEALEPVCGEILIETDLALQMLEYRDAVARESFELVEYDIDGDREVTSHVADTAGGDEVVEQSGIGDGAFAVVVDGEGL